MQGSGLLESSDASDGIASGRPGPEARGLAERWFRRVFLRSNS